MKRLRTGLHLLVLCCTLILCAATASAADSGLAALPKLSKVEIIDLLQNPRLTDPDNYYEEEPSITAPYTPGVMRQELLDAGLQRTNVMRRLAGLGDVTMNEEFNVRAQYGSVVLAAGQQFTHYPAKPEDMDEAFFEKAAQATAHSNLAYYGYGSSVSGAYFLPDPLSWSIDGYMSDSDRYNVEVVGHRRWMIDPRLTQVGMGAAHIYYPYRDDYGDLWYCTDVYSATYWDVDFNIRADYDFISWPASGLFPNTNFIVDLTGQHPQSDAWSIALNPRRYQTPDLDQVTVTLSGSGDSWTFSADQEYAVADTGLFFTVDTQSCGEGAVIIFRPDVTRKYEGVYTVSVSGLKTVAGADATLEYSVEFFTPTCLDGHSFVPPEGSSTCTAPFSGVEVCSQCGKEEYVELPPLGHLWGDGVSVDDESHTVTCTRPGCGEAETRPHDKQYSTVEGAKVCTCSGCDLYTVQVPTLGWAGPGRVVWEAVDGAQKYVVLLLDENGERVGSNRTSNTDMELVSFMGWYLDNTSRTYRVVVEARDAGDRKIRTLDSGLYIRAEVSSDPLPYSSTSTAADQYTMTIKQGIHAGDILLDTWFTASGGKSCIRTEFTTGCPMYTTSPHPVLGVSHQVRLLTDSRLVDEHDWCFTATNAQSATAESIATAPADVEKGLQSPFDSPVVGFCLLGSGDAQQRSSAFVMLQNRTGSAITVNVFVAEYDSQDRMLACGTRQLVLDSYEESGTLLYTKHPDTAKLNIFVLDQTFHSLTFKLPAAL